MGVLQRCFKPSSSLTRVTIKILTRYLCSSCDPGHHPAPGRLCVPG